MATESEPSTEFWAGYEAAIDAVQNRIIMLRGTVNRNTRPMDFLLDLQKEVLELKNIHGPSDIADFNLPPSSNPV